MRALMLSMPLLFVFSAASAQTWKHEYAEGETASQITSCNARIDYPDGSVVLRIYGDFMDMFFWQDSLSVPSGSTLGNVALTFKSEVFVASAESVTADTPTIPGMFFTPAKGDYEKILNAMRYGSEMGVVFPDGTGFTISLVGSSEALADAARCWSSNPTGPAGRNPFIGSSGNNPFE